MKKKVVKKKSDKSDTQKSAMIQALKKCLGNVSEAIEKVKIARSTHYEWLANDPTYKAECEQIKEHAIDFTEGKLFEKINGYKLPETKVFCSEGQIITHEMEKHYPPDTAAIVFYLKTQGKKRGYIERSEITGVDGEALQLVVVTSDEQAKKNLSKITSRQPGPKK